MNNNFYQLIVNVWGLNTQVEFEEPFDYDQSIILMSTHCSSFDVDINCSMFGKPVNFITKQSLFKVPLFGRVAKAFGHIGIDRSNIENAKASLRAAAKKTHDEKRVIGIYPEGTRRMRRSIGNVSQLLKFKKGGCHLARDSQSIIVPTVHVGLTRIAPTWIRTWGKFSSSNLL